MLAHAFIKSYLFLTAPSILHHLHGKLDPARREAALTLPTAYLIVTLLAALMVAAPLLVQLLPGASLPGQWSAASWILGAGGLMALFSAGYYAYSLTHKAFVADDHGHGNHAQAPTPGHLPAGPVTWPLALIALAAGGGLLLQLVPGGVQGSWFRALLGPIIREPTAAGSAATELQLTLAVLLLAMVIYAAWSALFLGRFRAESTVPLARHRFAYVAALNRFWVDAVTRYLVVGSVRGVGAWLDRFDTRVVDRLVGWPNAVAERLASIVTWVEQTVVAAFERTPGATARHLGGVVDSLDVHALGNAESAIKGSVFALARLGQGIERLITGTESALQGLLGSIGRAALGFERLLGRTFGALAVVALALLASFVMGQ
jgi:NADH:ubiquinone oxidoreductase subunit 5 (subunit L)/multisubunit Na+/H+ antiporter MnhA subunit